MDGTAERRQPAHALRGSTDAALDIATLRPNDAEAKGRPADQAVATADEVDERVDGPKGGGSTNPPPATPMG